MMTLSHSTRVRQINLSFPLLTTLPFHVLVHVQSILFDKHDFLNPIFAQAGRFYLYPSLTRFVFLCVLLAIAILHLSAIVLSHLKPIFVLIAAPLMQSLNDGNLCEFVVMIVLTLLFLAAFVHTV